MCLKVQTQQLPARGGKALFDWRPKGVSRRRVLLFSTRPTRRKMPLRLGSGGRSTNYESKTRDVEELESLATKLTADLQRQLCLIASNPVLSDEWVAMAELCGRIAHIAEVEAGLGQRQGVTMWEGEELALRYLMEESKLNVCLRNLSDFRDYIWGEGKGKESAVLDGFEVGMGLLLRRVWQHVEAVQTTDLPLLVSYIGRVLTEAVGPALARCEAAHKAGDFHQRQECLVVHYLHGLCSTIDDIAQLGFVALVLRENIFDKLVAFVDCHAPRLLSDDLLATAQVLAHIVDTEDFQTYQDVSHESARALRSFREVFLEDLTQDYATRKALHPLLRYIQVRHRPWLSDSSSTRRSSHTNDPITENRRPVAVRSRWRAVAGGRGSGVAAEK